MPTTYTETPDNFNEIGTFVEKEINGIKRLFHHRQKVFPKPEILFSEKRTAQFAEH